MIIYDIYIYIYVNIIYIINKSESYIYMYIIYHIYNDIFCFLQGRVVKLYFPTAFLLEKNIY